MKSEIVLKENLPFKRQKADIRFFVCKVSENMLSKL